MEGPHIVDNILEDDLRGTRVELENYGNVSATAPAGTDKKGELPPSLPISNRDYLQRMIDQGRCSESGHVIYLEFDLEQLPLTSCHLLRVVGQGFVDSEFTFCINVLSPHTARRPWSTASNCCSRT